MGKQNNSEDVNKGFNTSDEKVKNKETGIFAVDNIKKAIVESNLPIKNNLSFEDKIVKALQGDELIKSFYGTGQTIGGEKLTKHSGTVSDNVDDFKQRARLQSGWEQALNGVVIQGLGGEIIGGGLMSIGAIAEFPKAIYDEISGGNADFSNALMEYGKSITEYTQEKAPVYRLNPNETFDMDDPAWWWGHAPSVLSTFSLMFPAMGATRLFGAAAKGLNFAKAISPKSKLFAQIGSEAAMMRVGENFRDALNTYQTAEQEALSKFYNMDFNEWSEYQNTDIIKQFEASNPDLPVTKENIAKYAASLAGWEANKINSANFAFDVLQLLPFYRAGLISTRKAATATTAAAEKVARGLKTNVIDDLLKFKPATFFALEAGSEGIEELVNFIGENEGLHYAKTLIDNKEKGDFNKRLSNYLKDPHGWESAFWGAIGGAAFSGAARINDLVQGNTKKSNDKRVSEINSRKLGLLTTAAAIKSFEQNINPHTGKEFTSKEEKENTIIQTIRSAATDMALNASRVGNAEGLENYVSSDAVDKIAADMGLDNAQAKLLKEELKSTIFSAEATYKAFHEQIFSKTYSNPIKELLVGRAVKSKSDVIHYEKIKDKLDSDIAEAMNNDAYLSSLSPEQRKIAEDTLEKIAIKGALRNIQKIIKDTKDPEIKKILEITADSFINDLNTRLESFDKNNDTNILEDGKLETALYTKKIDSLIYDYIVKAKAKEINYYINDKAAADTIQNNINEKVKEIEEKFNERIDKVKFDKKGNYETVLNAIEKEIKSSPASSKLIKKLKEKRAELEKAKIAHEKALKERSGGLTNEEILDEADDTEDTDDTDDEVSQKLNTKLELSPEDTDTFFSALISNLASKQQEYNRLKELEELDNDVLLEAAKQIKFAAEIIEKYSRKKHKELKQKIEDIVTAGNKSKLLAIRKYLNSLKKSSVNNIPDPLSLEDALQSSNIGENVFNIFIEALHYANKNRNANGDIILPDNITPEEAHYILNELKIGDKVKIVIDTNHHSYESNKENPNTVPLMVINEDGKRVGMINVINEVNGEATQAHNEIIYTAKEEENLPHKLTELLNNDLEEFVKLFNQLIRVKRARNHTVLDKKTFLELAKNPFFVQMVGLNREENNKLTLIDSKGKPTLEGFKAAQHIARVISFGELNFENIEDFILNKEKIENLLLQWNVKIVRDISATNNIRKSIAEAPEAKISYRTTGNLIISQDKKGNIIYRSLDEVLEDENGNVIIAKVKKGTKDVIINAVDNEKSTEVVRDEDVNSSQLFTIFESREGTFAYPLITSSLNNNYNIELSSEQEQINNFKINKLFDLFEELQNEIKDNKLTPDEVKELDTFKKIAEIVQVSDNSSYEGTTNILKVYSNNIVFTVNGEQYKWTANKKSSTIRKLQVADSINLGNSAKNKEEYTKVFKNLLGSLRNAVNYELLAKNEAYTSITGQTYKSYKDYLIKEKILITNIGKLVDENGNKISNFTTTINNNNNEGNYSGRPLIINLSFESGKEVKDSTVIKNNTFKGVLNDFDLEPSFTLIFDALDKAGIKINSIFTNSPHAYYAGGNNTVYLPNNWKNISKYRKTEILAHEGIHGVISSLPKEQKEKLRNEIISLSKEIISRKDEILKKYKQNAPGQNAKSIVERIMRVLEYGDDANNTQQNIEDNWEELITYGLTNPEFALALNNLSRKEEGKETVKTLWNSFIEAIAKALNFVFTINQQSKLGELIEILNDVAPFNINTVLNETFEESESTKTKEELEKEIKEVDKKIAKKQRQVRELKKLKKEVKKKEDGEKETSEELEEVIDDFVEKESLTEQETKEVENEIPSEQKDVKTYIKNAIKGIVKPISDTFKKVVKRILNKIKKFFLGLSIIFAVATGGKFLAQNAPINNFIKTEINEDISNIAKLPIKDILGISGNAVEKILNIGAYAEANSEGFIDALPETQEVFEDSAIETNLDESISEETINDTTNTENENTPLKFIENTINLGETVYSFNGLETKPYLIDLSQGGIKIELASNTHTELRGKVKKRGFKTIKNAKGIIGATHYQMVEIENTNDIKEINGINAFITWDRNTKVLKVVKKENLKVGDIYLPYSNSTVSLVNDLDINENEDGSFTLKTAKDTRNNTTIISKKDGGVFHIGLTSGNNNSKELNSKKLKNYKTLSGGMMLIGATDASISVLVSGSPNDIFTTLKQLKNKYPEKKFFIFRGDTGTYNTSAFTNTNEVTENDIRNYSNKNTYGENDFWVLLNELPSGVKFNTSTPETDPENISGLLLSLVRRKIKNNETFSEEEINDIDNEINKLEKEISELKVIKNNLKKDIKQGNFKIEEKVTDTVGTQGEFKFDDDTDVDEIDFKFNSIIYGDDFVAPNNNTVSNNFDEPQINSNYFITSIPGFTEKQVLHIGNVFNNIFTIVEEHYENKLLGELEKENIDLKEITRRQFITTLTTKNADGSRDFKEHLTPEQIDFSRKVNQQLTQENSELWEYIKYYIEQQKGIKIIDLSDLRDEETGMLIQGWDREAAFKKPSKDKISKVVKNAITTTFKLNENGEKDLNTFTGIPEALDFNVVYPKLQSELGNILSKDELFDKIMELSLVLNPSFRGLYEKLKASENLSNAFYNNFTKPVSKKLYEKFQTIENKIDIKVDIANKSGLYEFSLANEWQILITSKLATNYYNNEAIKNIEEAIKELTQVYKNYTKAQVNTAAQKIQNVFNTIGIKLPMLGIIRELKYGLPTNKKSFDNDLVREKELILEIRNQLKYLKDFIISERDSENPGAEFKERGNLLRTAKRFKRYFYTSVESSSIDIKGNLVYGAQDANFLTDFFKTKYNDKEFEKVLFKYAVVPHMQHDNWLWNSEDSPGFLNYVLVKGKKEAVSVNWDYVEEFEYYQYEGATNVDNQRSQKYTEIDDNDWKLKNLIHYLSAYSNNKNVSGFFFNVPADRSYTNILNTYRIEVTDTDYNNIVNLFKNNSKEIRDSNIWKAVYNTIKQEIVKINEATELLFEIDENHNLIPKKENYSKLIKNYHYKEIDSKGNPILLKNNKPTGEVFAFHNMDIISNGKQVRLHEYVEDLFINGIIIPGTINNNKLSKIKEFVDLFLKQQFQEAKELKKYEGNLTSLINKKDYNKFLFEFVINQYLFTISEQNFFGGNTPMYNITKNNEVNYAPVTKRGGQFTAPGSLMSVNNTETARVLTINDVEKRSDLLKDIKDNLVNKKLSSFYEEINIADAQSFITLDEYEKRLLKYGKLTPELKEVIKLLRNGDIETILKKGYTKVLSPFKEFVYSYRFNEDLKMFVPVQIKNSEQVLIPALLKGSNTKLEKLLELMEKEKIVQVNFESAEKVGTGLVLPFSDKATGKLNDISKIDIENFVNNRYYIDYRYQQEIPYHVEDTKNTLGRQITKKILDNVPNNHIYTINGKEKISGLEIKNQIDLIRIENIIDSAQKILDKFDVNLDIEKILTGNYEEDIKLNIEKLVKFIKETLLSTNSLDNNMIKTLSIEFDSLGQNATTYMPFSYSVYEDKFLSIATSIFTNNVIAQKFPGGHLVQMSNVFMDAVGDKPSIVKQSDTNNTFKKLNYMRQGKDGLIEAEVLMPAWAKEFFQNGELIDIEELEKEGLTTMLGYRIPTEAKYSTIVFKVVGFLPKSANGSSIIVPDEFVAQTGSDFDVDSIYTMQYNYKTNINYGQLVKYLNKLPVVLEEYNKITIDDVINLMTTPVSELKIENDRKIVALINEWKKSFKLTFSKVKYDTSLSVKNNSIEARQNRLLDLYISILKDKIHYDEIVSPSTFSNIAKSKEDLEKETNFINPHTFKGKLLNRERVIEGRDLKGFSVARDGMLSVSQRVNLQIDKDNVGVLANYKIAAKTNIKKEEYSKKYLTDLYGVENVRISKDGKTATVEHKQFGNNLKNNFKNINNDFITIYAAETTANILDNVSYPIPKNVNTFTFGVWRLFPEVGSTYDYATAFIQQPILVELSKLHFNENSILNPNIDNASKLIQTLKRKYLTELYKKLKDENKITKTYTTGKDIINKETNEIIGTETVTKIGYPDYDKAIEKDEYIFYNEEKIAKRLGYTFNDKLTYKLNYLKNNVKNNKMSSNDIKAQLNILKLFERYNNISEELNNLQKVISTDKNSVSIDSVNELYENLDNVGNILSINNQNPVTEIYPFLYSTANKKSVYPVAEAYFKYGNILALNLFGTLTLKESSSFKDAQIELNSNKSNTIKKFYNYTRSYIYNLNPFFNINNTEKKRILGILDFNDINHNIDFNNEDSLKDFKKLSTAEKINLIKYSEKYKFYEDPTHILYNLIGVNDPSEIERIGYARIESTPSDYNNHLLDSFNNMYFGEDLFLQNIANDLIQYAFLVDGLNFGYNSFAKIIPVTILKSINIDKTLKKVHEQSKNGDISFSNLVDSFYRANHNDNSIVPFVSSKKFVSNSDGIIQISLDEFKELRSNITTSPYIKINDTLYEKYDNFIDKRFIYYFPINKLMKYEYGVKSILDINNVNKERLHFINEISKYHNKFNPILQANQQEQASGFKPKPDVILPIGTSGSGKSTFIKTLPQENLVVIEPDAMRVEFTGDINDKSKDKEIYEEAANRAIQAIKQGKQVVFDTTNLTKDKRLPFIEAIKKAIPTANIQYKLMELNPELAKQRIKAQIEKGENRANVPDSTIDRHAESYKQMLEDIKNEPISNFEIIPQQNDNIIKLKEQVSNLSEKNIFTVKPIQSVDVKAKSKAKIATQYIGFAEGIAGSSTALYAKQAGQYANTGNYSSNDVIFVSVGGKRGSETLRKQQQDRTISEAIKALEAGATLITDNAAYVESNSYNEGEKRLAANLKAKGYNYSETIVDGNLLGVWNKLDNNTTQKEKATSTTATTATTATNVAKQENTQIQIDFTENTNNTIDGTKENEKDYSILTYNPNNLVYSGDQVNALTLAQDFLNDKNANFLLIKGYAGTGKTTIAENVKMLLEKEHYQSPLIIAPTNTAVKNLLKRWSSANKENFKTVHSTLYFAPTLEESGNKKQKMTWAVNPSFPENGVIIIDEASMLAEPEFNLLIKLAKEKNTKLIFLGDSFQLPPVGKNPNLFNSTIFGKYVTELKQVQRNSGHILNVATHLRNVEKLEIINYNSDSFAVVTSFISELYDDIDRNTDFYVLTFTNRKRIDYNTLVRKRKYASEKEKTLHENEQLIGLANQNYYSNSENFKVKSIKGIDKLVFQHNNIKQSIFLYEVVTEEYKNIKLLLLPNWQDASVSPGKEYFSKEGKTVEKFSLLDSIGFEFFERNDLIVIDEDSGLKSITKNVAIATYGYATTVHKSQGGQKPHIYIDVDYFGKDINPAKIIYTAITRAESKVRLLKNNKFSLIPENKALIDVDETGANSNIISYEEVADKLNELQKGIIKQETHYDIDANDMFSWIDVFDRYERVSNVIGNTFENEDDNQNSISLIAGTATDRIIRDYFNGVKEIDSTGFEEKAFNKIINYLNSLKEVLDREGIVFFTNNLVVYGKQKSGAKIAGELDILSFNKTTGEFGIIDVKTSSHSFKTNYFKKEKEGNNLKRSPEKQYSLQTSAYKNLFEQLYNLPISFQKLLAFQIAKNNKGVVTDIIPEDYIDLSYDNEIETWVDKSNPKDRAYNTATKNEAVQVETASEKMNSRIDKKIC